MLYIVYVIVIFRKSFKWIDFCLYLFMFMRKQFWDMGECEEFSIDFYLMYRDIYGRYRGLYKNCFGRLKKKWYFEIRNL